MKDKRLIIKLKSGDKKAFSKIMDMYTSYAYTIARNIIGSRMPKEDIEETVIDSFTALWYNAHKLREDCGLSPYIAAIVRNQARNKLRKCRCEIPLDEVAEITSELDNFHSRLDLAETVKAVMEAAGELSDTDREIFIRHCWYGEKLEPIADRLGLTLSNCKTKLCRTKVKIRKYLIERGYGCEKE
ncbi:MAG: RNA polymerase sigma factor [Porcipelethomonas sp.]